MPVAERYILRNLLVTSGLSLATILVLVMITQVLIFLNVVTNSSEALLTLVKLVAGLVPSLASIVLPFALLIAVGHTFNRMHTDSEIIVLEAAGAPRTLQIRPVMLLAAAMSLLTLASSLLIEPYANRQVRTTIYESASNIVQFAAGSGAFHRIEDNLYLQFGGQHGDGDFSGLFIADMREAESEFIYYANRGRIVTQPDYEMLVMFDGEIHRRNARTAEVSTITFASYALDLADFGPSRGTPFYQPKERPSLEVFWPNPRDSHFQQQPHRFRGEAHRRLTEWLYPLAFGLVALYFSIGARSNREEQLLGLGAAVATALAFRGGGFIFLNDAGRSAFASFMLYFLPLSCIGLFGWLLLSGRRARIPQRWLDRLSTAVTRFEKLRQRGLRGWLRPGQGAAG
jgi:lipopolysaccharide export system permease protein